MRYAPLLAVLVRLAFRLAVRPVVAGTAVAAVNPAPLIEVHDLRGSLPGHPTKEYPLRPNGIEDIDGAVIHHSVTPQGQDPSIIDRYHVARGWAGLGYAEGVDFTGARWIFNDHDRLTYHAGGHNTHTLGLVCIGNYEKDTVTPEMEATIKYILSEWNESYDLAYVWAHCWTKATACPGKNIMELDIFKGPRPARKI